MATEEIENEIKERLRKCEESKPQPDSLAYILAHDKKYLKRYGSKTITNPNFSKEAYWEVKKDSVCTGTNFERRL